MSCYFEAVMLVQKFNVFSKRDFSPNILILNLKWKKKKNDLLKEHLFLNLCAKAFCGQKLRCHKDLKLL
jgi:hypothetical protein